MKAEPLQVVIVAVWRDVPLIQQPEITVSQFILFVYEQTVILLCYEETIELFVRHQANTNKDKTSHETILYDGY
ncbi:MAG: hypothetical protein ACYS5F_15320 [Planctomycetota bacterium]|jgi:hypothetical protein